MIVESKSYNLGGRGVFCQRIDDEDIRPPTRRGVPASPNGQLVSSGHLGRGALLPYPNVQYQSYLLVEPITPQRFLARLLHHMHLDSCLLLQVADNP
jgi:hypothetical protein